MACEVKRRNAPKLVLPIILIIYNLFIFNNLYLTSDSALYNFKTRDYISYIHNILNHRGVNNVQKT